MPAETNNSGSADNQRGLDGQGQQARSARSGRSKSPFDAFVDALKDNQGRFERRLQRAPWSVGSAGLVGFVLLSVFSCMGPQNHSVKPKDSKTETREITGEPWIRVLLASKADSATLAIKGLAAVHTVNPKTGKMTTHAPITTLDGLPASTVRVDGQAVVIEGQARYSAAIALRPKARDALTINGVRYRGDVILRPENGKLRVINDLPLEDYLCGVLPREMPLSFPQAALEAQAIAARTYAMYHLRHRDKYDHDVKNDTRSQVYGGLSAEYPKARKIIELTRGMVATYEGRIFQTYFHSTCGGETIPAHWVFGGKPFAPLDGAKCGHCLTSKYYRWEKQMSRQDCVQALRSKGYSLVTPVETIMTVGWDRSRYQKSVVVNHGGGRLEIPATKFRSALKMRSTNFDLKIKDDKLSFDGGGWGHGVGLCQVGARGFAQAGMSGIQIVEHYYPKSSVTKKY